MKQDAGNRPSGSVDISDGFDPYQALGLDSSVSQRDIEAVWERLSRDYDPDDYDSALDREEAEKTLAEARRAYDLLAVRERRDRVDRLLEERMARQTRELVRQARVVEHCFCRELKKRFGVFGNLVPRGRGDTFTLKDAKVHFWAHIQLSGPVDLRLEWYGPRGQVYRFMEDTVTPVSGRFFFTAWLYTHRLAKQGLYGTWKVRLTAGGEELAAGEFVFKSDGER